MDDKNRERNAQWVYSGAELKRFLKLHNISYKEAAAVLGIDKNTVGKAVRGGNLNINIILLICNRYDLDIRDFFNQLVAENRDSKNHYFSTDISAIPAAICAEEDLNYKKSKNIEDRIENFTHSLRQMQELISGLNDKLNEGYRMLDELKKSGNQQ